MLSWVLGVVSGICQFLGNVLPDSPFQSFIATADGIQTGLGYLNWLVPIGDLILIFAAWLGVLLVWAAADFLFGTAEKSITLVRGGS